MLPPKDQCWFFIFLMVAWEMTDQVRCTGSQKDWELLVWKHLWLPAIICKCSFSLTGTALSILEYMSIKETENQLETEFQFTLDFEYYLRLEKTWLVACECPRDDWLYLVVSLPPPLFCKKVSPVTWIQRGICTCMFICLVWIVKVHQCTLPLHHEKSLYFLLDVSCVKFSYHVNSLDLQPASTNIDSHLSRIAYHSKMLGFA